MKTFLVSLAFAAASIAGFAQCQTGRVSVNEELHTAGNTVVATVEAANAVPETDAHLDGVDYVVRVDRVLRGQMVSSNTVHIFSENSAAKFPMQTGKQYLLFVHQADGTNQIDNCGNSGLIQAASVQNAAALKQLAKN